MNNSKIWLVVKPTVGIPIFLGAVAVGSFAVHVAVLTNTGWVSDFLSGNELGSSQAALHSPALTGDDAVKNARVIVDPNSADPSRITVVLPDGRTATAVLEEI